MYKEGTHHKFQNLYYININEHEVAEQNGKKPSQGVDTISDNKNPNSFSGVT